MTERPKQEQHKMVLVHSHPSGEDEFYCPTCEYRILIQWPPDYKKTVLNLGDEYAIHSSGKGGLEMGTPQLTQHPEKSTPDAAILSSQEKDRLGRWEYWLKRIGFGNW